MEALLEQRVLVCNKPPGLLLVRCIEPDCDTSEDKFLLSLLDLHRGEAVRASGVGHGRLAF